MKQINCLPVRIHLDQPAESFIVQLLCYHIVAYFDTIQLIAIRWIHFSNQINSKVAVKFSRSNFSCVFVYKKACFFLVPEIAANFKKLFRTVCLMVG